MENSRGEVMAQTVILRGLEQRALACELVRAAPVNATVTIKPEGRNLDQNAKLWAMLSDISRAKPEGRRHTPEVWKAIFMNACGYEVQFTAGLSGEPFPVGFRSSRLSKVQMSELIEFIYSYGAQDGVIWSG